MIMRVFRSLFRAALFVAASLAALVILLRVCGVVAIYKVPTDAMAPFLIKGETIIAQALSLHGGLPKRGDVVTFTTEGIAGIGAPKPQIYIKRVAALPGDTVHLVDGRLRINDQPVSDYYDVSQIKYVLMPGLTGKTGADLSRPYTVPADHLLALGDNSPNSSDSRFWGPVPVKNLRQVYWFHLLRAGPSSEEPGGR